MATTRKRAQSPIKTKLGKWVARPLSNISPEVIPFWEGLKEHEFRLCRCKRCGACYWPYTVCIHHADTPDFKEMEWAPTSGRGKIFAHLVAHQVTDPDYAAEVPYVVALIEMEEGPLFPCRVVDCDPAQVKIGMPVEIFFYDVPKAGHTLPLFRPAR